MAVSSLRTINAAALAITTGYAEAKAAVVEALDAGTYDTNTLRYLRATVQGLLDDIRTLRRDLDRVAVEDYQRGTRADDTWTLVQWEREVRHQVGRLSYQLRRLWEALEALEQGAKRQLYVTRSGDTLQAIAARTLGDWQEWPRLLEANPSVSPGVLSSGVTLVIPDRR